jgi:hypothetical protein
MYLLYQSEPFNIHGIVDGTKEQAQAHLLNIAMKAYQTGKGSHQNPLDVEKENQQGLVKLFKEGESIVLLIEEMVGWWYKAPIVKTRTTFHLRPVGIVDESKPVVVETQETSTQTDSPLYGWSSVVDEYKKRCHLENLGLRALVPKPPPPPPVYVHTQC